MLIDAWTLVARIYYLPAHGLSLFRQFDGYNP